MINNCREKIWPAITAGPGFDGAGYTLRSGQSIVVKLPLGWNGRIWGRTGCNFSSDGVGTCQTGSCGETYKCAGSGKTPASLAEFNLAADKDFYDVSLVDGFNLPMVVTPINGVGNCSVAGCDGDLRVSCPAELSVRANGHTVGCRSACDVFDTDEYCCRGVYGNSAECRPTYYSTKFKKACPKAYTYAYDDLTSLFTCTVNDYVIAFCTERYSFPNYELATL